MFRIIVNYQSLIYRIMSNNLQEKEGKASQKIQIQHTSPLSGLGLGGQF